MKQLMPPSVNFNYQPCLLPLTLFRPAEAREGNDPCLTLSATRSNSERRGSERPEIKTKQPSHTAVPGNAPMTAPHRDYTPLCSSSWDGIPDLHSGLPDATASRLKNLSIFV